MARELGESILEIRERKGNYKEVIRAGLGSPPKKKEELKKQLENRMRKFSTRRLISHRLIKEQHAPAFWQQTSLSYFCISEQQQLLSSLNENDLKIKALRDAAEPPLPYWKGNKQAAVADLCCSSCSQRSDANMLQLKSRSFRWAVALSEGKAITANLSVMLLQHFICSQPP